MAYLIDTDIFISAKNAHYPFDVCPGVWDWVIEAHARGEIVCTLATRDDLLGHDDELSQWAKARSDSFFISPGQEDLQALGNITQHVNEHKTYTTAAKNTFLNGSDYFVVGQALAGRHIVVTNEKPENSVHRIKIPNVCVALKVPFSTPWAMLRKCGAKFVLKK